MIKLEKARLCSRITRLNNSNIQQAATIRFYKQQLKGIAKRIETILESSNPRGYKGFNYTNNKKKPNFKKKKPISPKQIPKEILMEVKKWKKKLN